MRIEEEVKSKEEERQLLEDKRQQYIAYLYKEMADETTETGITTLNFRLADGTRVVRKFNKDATLETVYRFVEIYPLLKNKATFTTSTPPADYEHQYRFSIHSPYPRMEYAPDNKAKLCDIHSLWPSATLVVDME